MKKVFYRAGILILAVIIALGAMPLSASAVATYRVNYFPNGGVGNIITDNYTAGSSVTVRGQQHEYKSALFLGWAESNTASVPTYVQGDTFTINRDVNLYAIWSINAVEGMVSDNRYGITISGLGVTAASKLSAEEGVPATDGDAYTILNQLNEKGSVLSCYKLTATRVSQCELTVGINVSARYSGSTLTVVHIDENGAFEATDVRANGNRIYVKAKSLGCFAVLNGSYDYVGMVNGLWVNPFKDMTENDWFFESVRYAVRNGYMVGTGTGDTFEPTLKTSRAMVVTLLWRHAGQPEVKMYRNYTDLADANAWYYKPVRWAVSEGILTPSSANTVGHADNVTRQEMALMLYRYAGSPIYSGGLNPILGAFSDSDLITSEYRGAIAWCVRNKILGGYDGKFAPKDFAERAQVAALLQRYVDTLG